MNVLADVRPVPRGPGLWWNAVTGRHGLVLAMAVFALFWLTLLDFASQTPPFDNLEQLTWMRSLQWGYYKHPPLPTWLLWVAASLLGWSAWTTFVLGAILMLGAVAIMGAVVRETLGPRSAVVAMAAALCISFYSSRLNYYNHNIVLMLFVVASVWLWWRLLTAPRLRWWLLLGLVAGLAMLSKYQYVVAMLCGGWLFVRHGLWRSSAQRHGAMLALAVAALVWAPHGW